MLCARASGAERHIFQHYLENTVETKKPTHNKRSLNYFERMQSSANGSPFFPQRLLGRMQCESEALLSRERKMTAKRCRAIPLLKVHPAISVGKLPSPREMRGVPAGSACVHKTRERERERERETDSLSKKSKTAQLFY